MISDVLTYLGLQADKPGLWLALCTLAVAVFATIRLSQANRRVR